jgi:hypothetical protein
MAVKGVFTSDMGIVGDRKGDFASSLLQVVPNGNAPLFALTSGMESAMASDVVVTWFEENHLSGRIAVTQDRNTSDTTMTVDDASFVELNTIWLVEATGEQLFVTGVSGNTITVVRGFADTTPASIDGSPTAAPIQRLGKAFEEGSSRPDGVANLGFPRWNYCQIFRQAWDVTGTARVIEHYTGSQVAKNKRDAALFHAEDIERSLWFGKRTLGIKNNKPFRVMDGILTQITTNVETQAGNGNSVGYKELRDFLQAVFTRNIKGKPNERIAFCGNTVLGVIDDIITNLPSSSMNLTPGQTDFGMKVKKWMTPFGDISLMTHPLFNESPLWTKDLYVLHPGAVRLRYLRKTKEDNYDNDGTRAGVDADYGVYTTELCVQYMAEITGGKFTGIDTADTGA